MGTGVSTIIMIKKILSFFKRDKSNKLVNSHIIKDEVAIKHCDKCKEWEYECTCWVEAEKEFESKGKWQSSGLTRKELDERYEKFKKKMRDDF